STNEKAPKLIDALQNFSEWIPKRATVFGNGSDFDNVILSNAYLRLSMERPWPKFNDRCFRTIKSMFKSVQQPVREGVHHSALDDAKHQALWLLKIYEEKLK
ncbi:3'-5' exoribonuclease, partial [bacterium]|nr:3'-5' exoribonuclease [bacterium]